MSDFEKRIYTESKAIARQFIQAQTTETLCGLLAYAQDGKIDWLDYCKCPLGFVGGNTAEGFAKLRKLFPTASLAFGHLRTNWETFANPGDDLLMRRLIAMTKAELWRRERESTAWFVPAAAETVKS